LATTKEDGGAQGTALQSGQRDADDRAAHLDWATARHYRTGENPARWRGHLDQLLPPKSKVAPIAHHKAVSYADLPAFMAQLRDQAGVAARCLELTILTATRSSEAREARWSEIDLEARTWTIPAARVKAGKAHMVPLSDRALELLAALPRSGDFVFENGHAVSRSEPWG
jgi:integrase